MNMMSKKYNNGKMNSRINQVNINEDPYPSHRDYFADEMQQRPQKVYENYRDSQSRNLEKNHTNYGFFSP